MKKIFFCVNRMVLGGIASAQVTLLKKFDPKKYDITLCILGGGCKELIDLNPKYVKIITMTSKDVINYKIKERKYIDLFKIIINKIIKKERFNISLPTINEEFDYAICYHLNDTDCLKFTTENVKAKIKYTWIHGELKAQGLDPQKNIKYLKQYDNIISVSNKLTEEFKGLCPELTNKAITCYNIIDTNEIIKKSKDLSNVEEAFLKDKNLKFLSVGRLAKQKGFDIAIEAAKLLKENNIKFTWYIVGCGEEQSNLELLINKYNLDKEFILLGRKDNPFPYYANCDIYIQPSRFEAMCLTLTEALVFKKPSITTDFAGADEQIENGASGIIINNFEPKSICNAIMKIINDDELKNKIISNINNLDNEANWKKIEALFME